MQPQKTACVKFQRFITTVFRFNRSQVLRVITFIPYNTSAATTVNDSNGNMKIMLYPSPNASNMLELAFIKCPQAHNYFQH